MNKKFKSDIFITGVSPRGKNGYCHLFLFKCGLYAQFAGTTHLFCVHLDNHSKVGIALNSIYSDTINQYFNKNNNSFGEILNINTGSFRGVPELQKYIKNKK